MRNASKRFHTVCDSPARKWVYKADITLQDGTQLHLDGHDILYKGITLDHLTAALTTFEVGAADAGAVTLLLNNYEGKFAQTDFTGAEVKPYIGLIVEQNYETGDVPEWIDTGIYTAEKADVRTTVVRLEAYDHMMRFDRPYTESKLKYPATLLEILEDCCACCGVPLATRDFLNADYIVREQPGDSSTLFRDIVASVAQLAGCYACMDKDGQLILDWYDTSRPVCHISRPKEMWACNATITGVQIKSLLDGSSALCGEDGYLIKMDDNLLAQDGLEALCASLGEKLIGFTFRPFLDTFPADPTLECGDAVVLHDMDGSEYPSIISHVTYHSDGDVTVFTDAESYAAVNRTYYNGPSKAYAAAKKNTQKQISAYDVQAKQFAGMAAATVGYYTTEEKLDDGSMITYSHDKPRLKESMVIWKRSGNVMAVSNDGGKTWNGIDKNGDAVLQNLAAKTISADKIKTGTLQAADNPNVRIDLEGGEIKLQTAAGQGLTIEPDGDAVFSGVVNADGAAFANEIRWGKNKFDEYCKLSMSEQGDAVLFCDGMFKVHYIDAAFIDSPGIFKMENDIIALRTRIEDLEKQIKSLEK